jgi:hypothetical protein
MKHLTPSQIRRLQEDVVRRKTAQEVNERIDRQIERNVGYYATQSKEAISERIEELEDEWDVDRLLARNAAVIALSGTMLGALFNRGWLIIPLAVTSFLWHHMQKGWCPPLPVMRRMGVRTLREIECEIFALKVLRGDFGDISGQQAATVEEAAERTKIVLDRVSKGGHSNGADHLHN